MSDIVMGFDPSLTHFGWSVATTDGGLRFLDCGVWVTKPQRDDDTKTEGYARRCEWLASQLFSLIGAWGRPSLIACEGVALPFGKTSMQTVSALGRVRGLLDALAASQSLNVEEFNPRVLKRLATGDQSADKSQVITAMQFAHPELAALFEQIKAADIEHAADAAAALHAAHTAASTEE